MSSKRYRKNSASCWAVILRGSICLDRHQEQKIDYFESYIAPVDCLNAPEMLSGQLGTWPSRYWRYATFRYSIRDITVLGTRHIGTEWKANRYFQGIIIWLNIKQLFCIFFLHLDVVYTNLYVFFFKSILFI